MPGSEQEIHDLGVTRHLLLVARTETLDLRVGQQALNLPVGRLATFDPRRGADALA